MTYSSRLRVQLDLKQPTSNYGVVGRKVQSPTIVIKRSAGISEQMKDALAEKEMNQGKADKPYRKEFCPECFVQLTAVGMCDEHGYKRAVTEVTKPSKEVDYWLDE